MNSYWQSEDARTAREHKRVKNLDISRFLGFRSGVAEVSVLLPHEPASLNGRISTFRHH